MRSFGKYLALLVFLPTLSHADAADPAVQQVTAFYAVLEDTMKHGAALGIEGRYKKLEPAVEAAYDIPTAAQYSAGPAWSTFSESDRKALIAAFERMTVASYANNFSSYDGEKFPVDPTPVARGADKIVQSKIATANDTPVPMNYRLRQTGGTWKIVDVYLNGSISQLATRRSDYSATIASEGAAGLVKKLNALSDRLMSAK